MAMPGMCVAAQAIPSVSRVAVLPSTAARNRQCSPCILPVFVSQAFGQVYCPLVAFENWSEGIRRIGVSLWIETAIIMAAALWLLLFVAPALFNAHTSTGLWLAILLFLLALFVLAAMLARVVRTLRATGDRDEIL